MPTKLWPALAAAMLILATTGFAGCFETRLPGFHLDLYVHNATDATATGTVRIMAGPYEDPAFDETIAFGVRPHSMQDIFTSRGKLETFKLAVALENGTVVTQSWYDWSHSFIVITIGQRVTFGVGDT